MPPLSIRDKARADARMEAIRALVDLGIDQSQPVDIFKIIQDAGIWLMFQPLKNLYGAFMPQDAAAGIIVHSNHPLSLQRFTAAHEFGHYILKHPLTLDDEGMIKRGGDSSDLREVQADAFAAHFLMPLTLVNHTLVRMGLPINPNSLTALQVYRMSLDMGVSYSATVNHLATLNKISRALAAELRDKSPKSIKTLIAGMPIENSWADIWVLDKSNTGKHLSLRVYDELRISLPETPSTGYIWTIEDQNIVDKTKENEEYSIRGLAVPQQSIFADTNEAAPPPQLNSLAFVHSEFEVSSRVEGQTRIGSGGDRYMTFRVLRPGQHTLRLLKRRPWQMTAPPVEVFEMFLNVTPAMVGMSLQQQKMLATAV